MRNMLASIVLAAVSIVGAPVVSAGPQAYLGDTIRCESDNGRTRECVYGGGYGNDHVELARQLSQSACIQGRTWGYGNGRIWVSQGCRAEFRVGGGNLQTFRCESISNRYNRCAVPSGRGGVQLVRQLSDASCIQGRTWGYDGNSVWVSNGCRGEFGVSRFGNGSQGDGRVFRCESENGRTRQCPADTRGGVRLVRQLSNAACVQGRSWGFSQNGIWVSDGCRGEFMTGQRGNYGYGGQYGNTGSGQVFRCESEGGRYNRCNIATGGRVQLVRQLSDSACIQGRTWGFDRTGVWVDQGCRAEFRGY